MVKGSERYLGVTILDQSLMTHSYVPLMSSTGSFIGGGSGPCIATAVREEGGGARCLQSQLHFFFACSQKRREKKIWDTSTVLLWHHGAPLDIIGWREKDRAKHSPSMASGPSAGVSAMIYYEIQQPCIRTGGGDRGWGGSQGRGA